MTLSSKEIETLHEIANSMLPSAISYGRRICNLDLVTAEELLMQAVAKIINSKKTLRDIKDLSAYLFIVYKHLLISWSREKQRERSLDGLEVSSTSYQEIEKKILLEEIIRMMTTQERFIYDHLVLGYSYEEIAKNYNIHFKKNFSTNVLRSKFSKATQRISKLLIQ